MAPELSDDERQLLASLPQTIGGAMAFAGDSGFAGGNREMAESSRAYLDGARDYPDNALICSLVPASSPDRRQAEVERLTGTRDWMKARMKAKGVDSPERLRALAIADAAEASALLAGRTDPKTAAEYRAWVMKVAERVAEAASEGGFLGFGGEQLSAAERELLAELETALGRNAD